MSAKTLPKEPPQETEAGRPLNIRVKEIAPFETQPREYFAPDVMEWLVSSIRECGLEKAVTVTAFPSGNGYRWKLVDGERRFKAHQILDLEFIPAIIKDPIPDDEDRFERSVISNFNSQEHTVPETIKAVARLRKRRSVEYTSHVFGKSTVWVWQCESLANKLDPSIIRLLGPEVPKEERISFQNALLLVDLPKEEQVKLAQRITAAKLGHAQAKHLVKNHAATWRSATPGGSVHSTHSKQKREFGGMASFFERTAMHIDLILDQPNARLDETCRGRTEADFKILIGQMEKAAGLLAETIEVFKKRQAALTSK